MIHYVLETSKDSLTDVILSNSVYSPESRMVLDLKAALSKLSKSQLANLTMIISIKCQDVLEDYS